MSTRALVAFAALALVACDGDGDPLDGGLMRDAAVGDGGGILDAGALDAAVMAGDAGGFDAGLPLCDAVACDPRDPRTGCGGEDACVLWGEAPACEDATLARLGAGMPCVASGECQAGLACFLEGAAGVCSRVCCPSDPMGCAVGSRCGGAGVLVEGTETGWGRCLAQRSCDLLRPTETCEPREGCYLIDTTMMTECRIAGSGAAGAPCELQEDCRAGFFCGGVAAARRCVRLCDLRADECPLDEGSCVAQSHTVAFENVGLCTLDMMTANR